MFDRTRHDLPQTVRMSVALELAKLNYTPWEAAYDAADRPSGDWYVRAGIVVLVAFIVGFVIGISL